MKYFVKLRSVWIIQWIDVIFIDVLICRQQMHNDCIIFEASVDLYLARFSNIENIKVVIMISVTYYINGQ